jgi:hypothetical protein
MPKRPTHLRVVGKEERPLTEKQEAFCQLVAKGRMLVEAYREAGYMPNDLRAKLDRLIGS